MKLIFDSRNLIFKKWGQDNERPPKNVVFIGGFLVRLIGIEPTHPAPEAGALSTELQAHMKWYGLVYHIFSKKQSTFLKKQKNFFQKNH